MKRQVIVAQGTVEGLAAEDQGITVFRGVPFAQPPVGGLRWRAPQPALPWDGVLQAFDSLIFFILTTPFQSFINDGY